MLVHRAQRNALAPAAPPLDEAYIFYFAGRPVAILKGNVPATLTRTYLTADHLGTPVLATSAAGVTVWAGGFEPFGADWSGAQGAGVFLRFPGQWEDASWTSGGLESGLYYNLHRWYQQGVGRYVSPDPIGLRGSRNLFSYAEGKPLKYTDPLGLRVTNNTRCVIYVKEANRSKTHAVQPGGTWPVEQDGYADPCKHPNKVFKTTDFVEVTVPPSHEPETTINSDITPFLTYVGSKSTQSKRGGWKGTDWEEELHDNEDYGWKEIFDKSKPENCCCTDEK